MHELSLAQEILDQAIAYSPKECYITHIYINLGSFSGVIKEAFIDALNILKENTIAKDSIIHLKDIPLTIYCNICKKEYELSNFFFICPVCNSSNVKILKGKDIELESIEVEKINT